ncbi:MAG: hypothetical protein AAF597_15460 [Bacteroidota bacterium]
MKYCFVILLSIALWSCSEEASILPVEQPEVTDFIIGTTGGWGGGYAFKLEDGQLQRSVEANWLGSPEEIAGETAFEDFTDEDAELLEPLIASFPEDSFAETPIKFDCPEQAFDGQCAYVIRRLSDASVQYWTRSEQDENSAVTDYLDRVTVVLEAFYE